MDSSVLDRDARGQNRKSRSARELTSERRLTTFPAAAAGEMSRLGVGGRDFDEGSWRGCVVRTLEVRSTHERQGITQSVCCVRVYRWVSLLKQMTW